MDCWPRRRGRIGFLARVHHETTGPAQQGRARQGSTVRGWRALGRPAIQGWTASIWRAQESLLLSARSDATELLSKRFGLMQWDGWNKAAVRHRYPLH